MARRMLGEELVDSAKEESMPFYEPSTTHEATADLVDIIMSQYVKGVFKEYNHHLNWGASGIIRLIFRREDHGFLLSRKHLAGLIEDDLDAQALLDGIILRLQNCRCLDDKVVDHLLTPLVQALYHCGYNGLELDLSNLPISISELAQDLKGTKKSPLVARFKTNGVENFGRRAKHCVLTLVGDVDRTLAEKAYKSSFDVHGTFEGSLREVEECSFYLDDLPGFPWTKSCTYHIRNPYTELEMCLVSLWVSGFFKDENEYLIRGGDGGWESMYVNPAEDEELWARWQEWVRRNRES